MKIAWGNPKWCVIQASRYHPWINQHQWWDAKMFPSTALAKHSPPVIFRCQCKVFSYNRLVYFLAPVGNKKTQAIPPTSPAVVKSGPLSHLKRTWSAWKQHMFWGKLQDKQWQKTGGSTPPWVTAKQLHFSSRFRNWIIHIRRGQTITNLLSWSHMGPKYWQIC